MKKESIQFSEVFGGLADEIISVPLAIRIFQVLAL